MKSIVLLAIVAFTVSANAAIDLAPASSEYEGEGIKYTRLTFKDDKRQVVYVPPQNWTCHGDSSQLRLTPPGSFSRADAIIETSLLAAPQPLDQKGVALLRQQFMGMLPPGAQAVKMLSEEASPLLLSGNIQTFEFTASYQILGEVFVRSALFANLPETQLRFKLTGLKRDFDFLHRQFRSSLISWQWNENPETVTTAQK